MLGANSEKLRRKPKAWEVFAMCLFMLKLVTFAQCKGRSKYVPKKKEKSVNDRPIGLR